jgi:hypothetical protein
MLLILAALLPSPLQPSDPMMSLIPVLFPQPFFAATIYIQSQIEQQRVAVFPCVARETEILKRNDRIVLLRPLSKIHSAESTLQNRTAIL